MRPLLHSHHHHHHHYQHLFREHKFNTNCCIFSNINVNYAGKWSKFSLFFCPSYCAHFAVDRMLCSCINFTVSVCVVSNHRIACCRWCTSFCSSGHYRQAIGTIQWGPWLLAWAVSVFIDAFFSAVISDTIMPLSLAPTSGKPLGNRGNQGLVASYDIRPVNREGQFLLQPFINLSLTHLLRHLPTHLQPRDLHGVLSPLKILGICTPLSSLPLPACHQRL